MRNQIKWLSGILLAGAAMIALPMTAEAAGKEMYCLYNSANKEFLYTIDENEKNNLLSTWEYKGVICTLPDSSSTPVYRLYDPASTQHLYTSDDAEINKLVGEGWKKEGIAYYVDDAHTAPVYRMFNPTTGEHQFSGSTSNNALLEATGWQKEGIAYYALSVVENIDTTVSAKSSDTSSTIVANDGSSVWGTYNGVDITRKNMYSVFKNNGWIGKNEYWIMDKINANYPGIKVTLVNGQDGCNYYEISSPQGIPFQGMSWNGINFGMTKEEVASNTKFNVQGLYVYNGKGYAHGAYSLKYDNRGIDGVCGLINLTFSNIGGKDILTNIWVDFDYRSN